MATSALALPDDPMAMEDLPPSAKQLAKFMLGLMGTSMTSLTDGIAGRLERACGELATAVKSRANDQHGHDHGGEACVCGGTCKSCKDGGSGGTCEALGACDTFPFPIPNETATWISGLARCYKPCRKLDKCIAWMLLEDRRDLDAAAWEHLLSRDGQLVHIDKSVGADPPYEDDFPLAAGEKILLSQSDEQQLSYWPELIKLEPDWNGTPVPSKVKLKWYTGDRGLTAPNADAVTSSLIQIGETQTLSDFACGTSCYVIPFPQNKMCPFGHIPRRRAVYLEVIAGAIGAATITGVNAVIIKRGTEMWERWAPMLLKIKACPG